MINPGEIYFATLNGAGRRPVIVVSKESFNRGRFVVVVPCTSRSFLKRKTLPNCVPILAGQFGLPQDCVAQCELIASIEVDSLDAHPGPIGTLDDPTWRSLIQAIGHVLDFACEPI
jgi:mRNA-degrading endonuclease toxin of MazEF toxin-antitoxin module